MRRNEYVLKILNDRRLWFWIMIFVLLSAHIGDLIITTNLHFYRSWHLCFLFAICLLVVVAVCGFFKYWKCARFLMIPVLIILVAGHLLRMLG